mmetsp:Transcript_62773/g.185384  ORF Transcript_62773/g.185384 Transcript_62773/m.185384 type:complete len:211 (-) Transcript_62773:36-668(-)
MPSLSMLSLLTLYTFVASLLFPILAVASDEEAASADCNGRNGGLYISLNEPCRVTFYAFRGETNETTADRRRFGSCDDVVDNEDDYIELTAEEAPVWPDMCLDDDPLRCYSVEDYRDLLTIWGGERGANVPLDDGDEGSSSSSDEDAGFPPSIPAGATHMMVNCTGDADDGIALSAETMAAMSAGVIAAIVIGVLVFFCLLAGLICCCCC